MPNQNIKKVLSNEFRYFTAASYDGSVITVSKKNPYKATIVES